MPAFHAECYGHTVVCGGTIGVALRQNHWPKLFRVCHSRFPPTVEYTCPAFADLTLNVSPPSILFGHTSIYTGTVNRAIQHIVCYVDRGSQKSYYPKCTACGFPGHTLDKCHPLVNFCLAQALTAHHPDIVKRIKAAYAQFPRSNRSCPPRVSSVKQLVSMLDLPPEESISGPDDQDIMHSSHHIDLIETLDLSAENVLHGHSGSAIVSFQDRSCFPFHRNPPPKFSSWWNLMLLSVSSFNKIYRTSTRCILIMPYWLIRDLR
jgi:hypothetical protein